MRGFFCASCPEAREALRRATVAVERLPNRDQWGKFVRCHEVARAVLPAVMDSQWEFEVVDGHLGWGEHSWLASRKLGVILDTYDPDRLPHVQLVDPYGPTGSLYRPGNPRRDIREEVVGMLRGRIQAV